MKKFFLTLFVLASILDLIGIYSEDNLLVYISKPLILVGLGFYYLYSTDHSVRSQSVLYALFFSFLGDVLLMWGNDFYMFIAGIIAFLNAQIFYILWSRRYQRLFYLDKTLVIYALIFAGMLVYLAPLLGDFLLPMMIYGLFLFLMSMQMTRISLGTAKQGYSLLFGGVLFVISDLCIAFSKFIPDWGWAIYVVMPTYIFAQGLLVFGIKKIDNARKNKN